MNKKQYQEKLKTGKLVIFEGLDGSGKTTQISLLSNYLKGIGQNVVTTREPGGTALAEHLRNLMLNEEMDGTTEMLIAFAARNDHVNSFIKPQLKSGKWVICDRFTDSTRAYQGSGRGISLNLINLLSENIEKNLDIHKVIFLDITPKKSQERKLIKNEKLDRFELENIEFIQRVRDGFKLAALNRDKCGLWISGNQSQSSIFDLIKKSVL